MAFRSYNTLACHEQWFHSVDEAYKYWYHNKRYHFFAFYIYDIPNNLLIPFQSKEEVMLWWRDHYPAARAYSLDLPCPKNTRAFDELNITGKDTWTSYCFSYSVSEQWNWEIHRHPRRLQVLDAEFRSIDIREWFDRPEREIQALLHAEREREQELFRKIRWGDYKGHNGRKCHWTRSSGPSMYRKTARNRERAEDDAASCSECPSVKKVHCLSVDDVWHAIDRQEFRKCSKSWKDQTKCRKQYMKRLPKSSVYISQRTLGQEVEKLE